MIDVAAVIQDIAELGDRISPDDQPEMMLVTADELRRIIERHDGPNDAQDAERYRWLRNGTLIPYLSPHVIAPVAGSDDRSVVRSPEELDAAMDLAMKRTHATGRSQE